MFDTVFIIKRFFIVIFMKCNKLILTLIFGGAVVLCASDEPATLPHGIGGGSSGELLVRQYAFSELLVRSDLTQALDGNPLTPTLRVNTGEFSATQPQTQPHQKQTDEDLDPNA
jgi:hypothetical protein